MLRHAISSPVEHTDALSASLIYLLLPLAWALPFFCLLHLFLDGLGMYFLAARWSGSRLGGALAGTIFAFNGLSLNFLMWPSHIATSLSCRG